MAKKKTAKKAPKTAKKQSMKKVDFSKIWSVILGFTSILFAIVAAAMILIDNKMLDGAAYLVTAAVFAIALHKICRKELVIDAADKKLMIFFNLGYVFSVIGLNMNLGIWAFGFALFSAGILSRKK